MTAKEKLSDQLWRILNDATLGDCLSVSQLCAIDAARTLAKKVEDAPAGEIVGGRANSFGGYNVEIKHAVSFVVGKRVRLVVEDEQ